MIYKEKSIDKIPTYPEYRKNIVVGGINKMNDSQKKKARERRKKQRKNKKR